MNGPVSSVDVPADKLQEGIYFRHGQRPGQSYRLLLLNLHSGTTASDARQAIAAVWTVLQEFRGGMIRDLYPPGFSEPLLPSSAAPYAGLTCLLGFGARLFSQHPTLVSQNAPRDARIQPELEALSTDGDGAPFPNLPWVAQAERSIGEADLAIQCIAEREFVVSQAVVEVWKVVSDQRLPLDIVALYSGFNRDDARSWIGFYDGINNIAPSQRRGAIEVVRKHPAWMEGGTYMAFLRLAIDLTSWRSLSRAQQEVLVGRDKLTGCPLEQVTPGPQGALAPVPVAACPVSGTRPQRPEDIDPPRPNDPLLQVSHMHRANHDRDHGSKEGSNRIFRQGYEFLELLPAGRLQVGLNFVSFQRSLLRLKRMLTFTGWLNDVNFGGPTRNPPPGLPSVNFLSVIAGGYYAVPPKGEPFPGADLF